MSEEDIKAKLESMGEHTLQEDNPIYEKPTYILEQMDKELYDKLPPEVKKLIANSYDNDIFKSGAMNQSFLRKINPSHITQYLQNEERNIERMRQESLTSKRCYLLYFLIICGLLIFIMFYFKDSELYKETLKLLIVFGGGIGTGMGIKSFWETKKPK